MFADGAPRAPSNLWENRDELATQELRKMLASGMGRPSCRPPTSSPSAPSPARPKVPKVPQYYSTTTQTAMHRRSGSLSAHVGRGEASPADSGSGRPGSALSAVSTLPDAGQGSLVWCTPEEENRALRRELQRLGSTSLPPRATEANPGRHGAKSAVKSENRWLRQEVTAALLRASLFSPSPSTASTRMSTPAPSARRA